MKATALLLELLRNGTQLRAEGDKAVLRTTEGVLTPALSALSTIIVTYGDLAQ